MTSTRRDPSAAVVAHYGQNGRGLVERVLATLRESGCDVEQLSAEMLYPLDQLHGRELAATREHLSRLQPQPDDHVLDIGAGIGGPARFLAVEWGCRVTGVDLTPEFVAAASELTERCGLGERVTFHHADALQMPFADQSFDAASCLYVAMNVHDKRALLTEIWRVLRPGARLVWSEVVLRGDAAPDFPLPWSREPEASFLVRGPELAEALAQEGFRVLAWHDETDALREYAEAMRAAPPERRGPDRAAVVGDDFRERLGNFNRGIADGRLGSVLVVAESAG